MSEIAVNAITDASGGSTASINGLTPTVSNMAGRNRIINGDMRIDQRNAGASVTLSSGGGYSYSADRWYVENNTDGTATIQQITDAPTGFSNSIRYTITGTDASLASDQSAFIQQRVEGFNSSDLAFGTASASTVTVSFWVKSSVTGTFGGALANSAYNRGYPFTFTISAANTWEQKSVTIPGDTTGTWIGATNGTGLRVTFALAAGSARVSTAGAWASYVGLGASGQVNLMATNGATWQITGVQLEVGSVATPFERRQYGQELALCQRYYQKSFPQATAPAQNVNGDLGANRFSALGTGYGTYVPIRLAVVMRAAATVTTYNPYNTNNLVRNIAISADVSSVGVYVQGDGSFAILSYGTNNDANNGQPCTVHWAATAEL